jgi:lanthanide-dependent methanol dehydrogenase
MPLTPLPVRLGPGFARPGARRLPTATLALLFAVTSVACGGDESSPDSSSQSAPAARAVIPPGTPAELAEDDGQWVMAPKNHASTRYSGLSEITTENVASLRLAWSFSTGVVAGHEAAPLVVGDTMYVVTPYPNILYALNLRDGEPRLRWAFEPKPERAAQGVACCDVVNRGAAYADGKVIFNTLDNQTVAVDAVTGRGSLAQQARRHQPRRVDDHGAARSEGQGPRRQQRRRIRRAWVADGAQPERWIHRLEGLQHRARRGCAHRRRLSSLSTSRTGAQDLGVHTWPPDMWRIGGGTVWGWISYDSELDLIYYGTSNPGPWNPELRPGDNKWTAAIFARNPTPARRDGRTSGAPTTSTITTASTRTSCSISRSMAGCGRSSSGPNATASCTCSIGRPARSCRPTRSCTRRRPPASI